LRAAICVVQEAALAAILLKNNPPKSVSFNQLSLNSQKSPMVFSTGLSMIPAKVSFDLLCSLPFLPLAYGVTNHGLGPATLYGV
jgi:hypothetical protein